MRIQHFAGLQLAKPGGVNRYDDSLESKTDFAFDERYGYLTARPTNVGTGLRASVMLHLPALIITKQINQLLTALPRWAAVRGLYGEGTIIGNPSRYPIRQHWPAESEILRTWRLPDR